MWMLERPCARESDAMKRPSGDRLGVPVQGPPNAVSCTALRPSASLVQTSLGPERFDSKVNRRPSGETDGRPWVRLEATNLTGGPTDRVGVASGTCQRLTL